MNAAIVKVIMLVYFLEVITALPTAIPIANTTTAMSMKDRIEKEIML